jgi:hypothetical protein
MIKLTDLKKKNKKLELGGERGVWCGSIRMMIFFLLGLFLYFNFLRLLIRNNQCVVILFSLIQRSKKWYKHHWSFLVFVLFKIVQASIVQLIFFSFAIVIFVFVCFTYSLSHCFAIFTCFCYAVRYVYLSAILISL